ncbi:MAG: helix-turn-helix domain-containing protein [candidate division WOR-3 bacterium]
MENLDFKILSGLERVSEIMKVFLRRESSKFKLSPTQVQILLSLLSEGNLKIKNLEKITSLDKTTLSKSIKNLQKKNFIEKTQSELDRREKILKIKENKKESIKNFSLSINLFKKVLKNFSEKEKEIILKFIFDFIDYSIDMGIISLQKMCSKCIYFKIKNNRFYCKFLNRELKIRDLKINCSDFVSIT